MASTRTWNPEWKKDFVYLHVFPRKMARGVPNFSPFAVKLETWLRINKIPFEVSIPVLSRLTINYSILSLIKIKRIGSVASRVPQIHICKYLLFGFFCINNIYKPHRWCNG